MSEVAIIVKDVKETAKSFNKRIGQACAEHSPTSIDFHVVHGEPMVILESEYDLATEEDVKNPDIEVDKVGDPVLEDPPLCCKVCIIKTDDGEYDKDGRFEGSKTEDRLGNIADTAGASAVEVLVATGFRAGWVEPAKGVEGGAQWIKQEVSYVLIIWEIDDSEEDADDGKPSETETEAPVSPSKKEEKESTAAPEAGASSDAADTKQSSEETGESGDAAE